MCTLRCLSGQLYRKKRNMSNKANFKAFEAAVSELSIAQYKDAIAHIRETRIAKRAAASEERAALKAQLAELTEKRAPRGGGEAEEMPKRKGKKSKRSSKGE